MNYVYWGAMCRGKGEIRDLFLMNNKKTFWICSEDMIRVSHYEDDSQFTSQIFTYDHDKGLTKTSRFRSLSRPKHTKYYNRYLDNDSTAPINQKMEVKRKSLLPYAEEIVDILNEYDPDLFIISYEFLVPYLDLNLKKSKHLIPYKSSITTHLKLVIDVGLNASKDILVGDYERMIEYIRSFDRSMKLFVDIMIDGEYDWEWFNLDDFNEYKKFGLEHTLNDCVYKPVELCFKTHAEDERFLFIVDAAKKYIEEYKDELYETYPLMK